MNIRELDEDNITEYQEWIDRDIAENMSRMYYRGIACLDDLDDELKAALIWELKSVEKQEDTKAEIVGIFDYDPGYMDAALEEYGKRINEDDVVRSYFEIADIGKETEETFAGRGFELTSGESRDLKISLRDFRSLSVLKKKAPDHVQSLLSIDTDQFNQGMVRLMFTPDAAALEDMFLLPKEWFDQRVSCCVQTDGRINGFLLVHRYPSGILTPVMYYAAGPYSKYDLLDMMRYSASSALDIYTEDTPVVIRRRNENIKALAGKLFPGKNGGSVMSGERREREDM